MPIWTDGRAVVVGTGSGIARLIKDRWEITRFPRGTYRRDEIPPLPVFCVLDAGERAVFRRGKEPLSVWAKGKVSELESARDIVAAAPLDDTRMLVIAPDAGELAIFDAKVEVDTVELGQRVTIPKPTRAEWSWQLFDKDWRWPEDRRQGDEDDEADDDEPDFEATRLGLARPGGGDVKIFVSPHGIAVTSTYGGLVVVLDPKTLAPRLTVRVPAEREQFEVFALPLEEGVLVTLVANARNTEFVMIANNGKVVGSRSKIGKEPAVGTMTEGVAWDASTVRVSACDAIHTLKLPALAQKQVGEGSYAAHASSADGSHVVAISDVGFPGSQHWALSRTTAGAKKAQELPKIDFRPPPELAAILPAGPSRASGGPSLGVVATSAWTAKAGETVELALQAINRGGAAVGMTIELAGAALGTIVEGVDATASGVTVKFETRGSTARASIPTAKIEAGFEVEYKKGIPPPTQPRAPVTVRVRGLKDGTALLTVRVSPGQGKGSAMMGKSFMVGG